MNFESPDVMKDFPGLYSTEGNKKCNESDYSDDHNEKLSKKDLLIGKRKDKKDTKKDRGYAALEGESSAEEDFESKSPSKTKKTKSFKFTTKTKEKRDKIRDKDKEVDKKKDKENRKVDRCKDKVKFDKKDKKTKSANDEKDDISNVLPIFGVSLDLAVERSRCHDNIDLPLPVRNCIDYIQEYGISFENVYKVSGIKSKVLHIKKLYNQREFVDLNDYDVPTATSVLKLFFRELPEPILTDLLTQFEEAAAIQNVANREISLISLLEKLPAYNRIILSWTILHLDTITDNEKITKMNAQSIAMTLSPTLQMSHRLLTALLCHCKSLFKDTVLFKYCPPLLPNTVQLPEKCVDILCELRKQESLLSQIHAEMYTGCISKQREELLWEVQRVITNLKRKLRSIQKCNQLTKKSFEECSVSEDIKITKSQSCSDDDTTHQQFASLQIEEKSTENTNPEPVEEHSSISNQTYLPNDVKSSENTSGSGSSLKTSEVEDVESSATLQLSDTAINLIQFQNKALMELRDSLLSQIAAEKSEIVLLKYCIANSQQTIAPVSVSHSSNVDINKLDELMDLISKENKILQIKKIDLVREIMEQRETCIYLQSKLFVMSQNVR